MVNVLNLCLLKFYQLFVFNAFSFHHPMKFYIIGPEDGMGMNTLQATYSYSFLYVIRMFLACYGGIRLKHYFF